MYFDYPVSVRYSDLSENGCLSDTAILDMMQEAALACDPVERGELRTQKYAWALCGWKYCVRRRPEWAEKLTVRTWLRAMERHTCDREYVIFDEAGEQLIAATSRWLLLNFATGRVGDVTDEIRSRYTFDHGRAMGEDVPRTIDPVGAEEPAFVYTVMQRDIDTLHHMNNLYYLALAREALPAELVAHQFENVEVVYRRQIKKGETVRFLYSADDGKHLVRIMNSDETVCHAQIRFF